MRYYIHYIVCYYEMQYVMEYESYSHKKPFSSIAVYITVWQQPLESLFPSCSLNVTETPITINETHSYGG